jgi:hypothetical protein
VFHHHFHEAEPAVTGPRVSPILQTHSTRRPPVPRRGEHLLFRDCKLCERGSPTTSAVVPPDGTLLSYQPYGKRGLLIADIDITEATGLLAARCKSI